MDQVLGQVVFVKLVQVEIAELIVGNLVGEHVIDRHQDFVGHGYRGALVSTPRFETIKLVPEVSALGVGRPVGRFDQGRLQIHIAFGNVAVFALTSRLVVAGTYAG